MEIGKNHKKKRPRTEKPTHPDQQGSGMGWGEGWVRSSSVGPSWSSRGPRSHGNQPRAQTGAVHQSSKEDHNLRAGDEENTGPEADAGTPDQGHKEAVTHPDEASITKTPNTTVGEEAMCSETPKTCVEPGDA